MFGAAAEEAIRLIPGVLWVLFAVVVLVIFYRPIRDDLIPRLSSLKLPFGLEVTLRERVAEAARKQNVTVSEDDKDRIVRRLERSANLLKGARILWVDDRPQSNTQELSLLATFGARVDQVTTNAEALDLLRRNGFDVLISDQKREGRPDAGEALVQSTGGRPWTILYIGDFDENRPTPARVFGVTDRPHQLLHFVLDALERQRA
jgi:hypothetical protein